MTSVLPEFVNKIVNKVTTNTSNSQMQQPQTTSVQSPTNSKVTNNAPKQSTQPVNASNSQLQNTNKSSNMNAGNNLGLNNELNNLNTSTSGANNLNASLNKNTSASKSNTSASTLKKTQYDVLDNLTNAEKMRELIDSVIVSDLDIDKRNRILNVIKTALTTTQAQENRDFDKFSQRYDAMQQPQNMYYPGYMPSPQNMYYPGYMQPPQNMYYPGYMQPPQNMYFPQQQQQPLLQYDMLFNKMNMIQMEMADLTRHLRDYTRRYMDNMRESDMDQIKNYIEELMKVQDSVNQVAETMQSPTQEPEEDKTSLMDKATTSLKSGLSTVTNTVNSIGSKLGLTEEPPVAEPEQPVESPAAEPVEEDISPEELEDEDLNNLPTAENNMMSVDDYAKQVNTPTQQAQNNQSKQANSPKQNNQPRQNNKKSNGQTKPAELSNAIKELNKQNQASAPTQQQGGGKKTKKEMSILEQFEKMLSIKRQTKKAKK